MDQQVHENHVNLPQQERGKFTFDSIVTAATRIFAGKGYATDTNRVAELAGVSVGTLYQYFPGKDALILWIMKRHLNRIAEIVEEEVRQTRGLSIEETVGRIVEATFRTKRIESGIEKTLLKEASRLNLWSHVCEMDRRIMETLHERLKEFPVRPKNLELATYILVHSIRAAAVAAAVQRPELLDDPEFGQELKTLVLAYLR